MNCLRSNSRLSLLVVLVLVSNAGIACKQKKKAASPQTPNKTETPTPNTPPSNEGSSNSLNPNGLAALITIDVDGQAADKTSFDVEKNAIVKMPLKIGGLTPSSNVLVGLAKKPDGTVLTDANTANPTITWTAATEGTFEFLVMVRDLDGCSRAGRNDCDFSKTTDAPINANPEFDATKLFTVNVKPRGSIIGNPQGIDSSSNNGSTTDGTNGSTNNGSTDSSTGNSGGGFFSGIFNAFSSAGQWIWNLGTGFFGFFRGLFS